MSLGQFELCLSLFVAKSLPVPTTKMVSQKNAFIPLALS